MSVAIMSSHLKTDIIVRQQIVLNVISLKKFFISIKKMHEIIFLYISKIKKNKQL